jgi:hypothetical protein
MQHYDDNFSLIRFFLDHEVRVCLKDGKKDPFLPKKCCFEITPNVQFHFHIYPAPMIAIENLGVLIHASILDKQAGSSQPGDIPFRL